MGGTIDVRDQLVEWFKPVECPEWMTAAEFAVLPAKLVLRGRPQVRFLQESANNES